MRLHFQTVAVHADRFMDPILPVYRKPSLDDMHNIPVMGNGDCLGGT